MKLKKMKSPLGLSFQRDLRFQHLQILLLPPQGTLHLPSCLAPYHHQRQQSLPRQHMPRHLCPNEITLSLQNKTPLSLQNEITLLLQNETTQVLRNETAQVLRNEIFQSHLTSRRNWVISGALIKG